MKNRPSGLGHSLLTWMLAAGSPACLDFTPITSFGEAPDSASTGGLDGGADALAQGQVNKCLACAAGGDAGGGCPNEYQACFASSPCRATALCATGLCLSSLATVSQCLAVCEADAGVSDPMSPGNVAFSALLSCMSTHCETACIP